MRSTWFSRAARGSIALALLSATAVAIVAAKPAPERPGRRRAVNLFAVTNAVLNVNRVYCGINNLGELCVDPTNSPVIGGGFWPKGTPDQYIFNSGLQLAGTVDTAGYAGAGSFPWKGDTIGAYFFDARGTQVQGDAVTLVYNSLDAADACGWPNGAFVHDTAIYDPILIDRADSGRIKRDCSGTGISQQDLWTRAWDGNPAFLSGRTHPMGIMVEERGLAWNYPTGNEDIIYFIFTFYNITARNCSAYAGLDPVIQTEVCQVGQNFQNRNEAVFNFDIPDGGYPISNLYASFSMDPDVGDASFDYSTAILPFSMGVAYKSDFLEPNWAFPPDIFGAPFVSSPGFVGVKYLRSPKVGGSEVGLTMFSNTRNSGTGFPDPIGVIQLFRYLSGTVSTAAGDNPCTAGVNPLTQHMCFLDQTAADTRFFQASGPFTLQPGASQTIVVAYVHAAPTPAVLPYVGGDLPPGIPAPGDTIRFTPSRIRTIERAAGWVSQADADGNDKITQDEVVTVPRSLLNKALVAQAVFDKKFLLPFAPEPPRFFLMPGDNQVTVVWQKSATETVRSGGGDPYFAVARLPLNPDLSVNVLYDPNFRQYDVEGYRIYRGRTTSALDLIAQFDYAGTSLVDYTGNFAYTQDIDGDGKSECAPEFGIQDDCPVTFPSVVGDTIPLVGKILQVPAGGRVVLADSSVLIVKVDTAVTGGDTRYPELSDNGVSFSFVDNTARNSFTYYYAVTAFDVNSLKSGPSSLESPRVTKPTTPRKASGQETAGLLQPVQLLAGDGTTLAPGSLPTLDAATGIFSGAAPPTDGLQLGLAAFLPQILASGSVTLTVDSIVPGSALNGLSAKYYVTAQGAGLPVALAIPVAYDAFSSDVTAGVSFPATAINTAKSTRYGGDSTFALFGSAGVSTSGTWRLQSWGRGDANGDPANSSWNGPRWWAGNATSNENTNDPNGLQCHPAAGGCAQADLSRNAGGIPGVGIFAINSYLTVQNNPPRQVEGITSGVTRAADFRIVWGANGAIDTVFDVTHQISVPFKTNIRASWGILNDSSFLVAGTSAALTPDRNNGKLTWTDTYCVDPIPTAGYLSPTTAPADTGHQRCGGGVGNPPAVLQNHARLSPVAFASSSMANSAALGAAAPTGNGFIFYLNGSFFLMQMAALPTAGTMWHARFYAGTVVGAPGSFTFRSSIRPPAVPGLRAQVAYQGSTFNAAVTTDAMLQRIHTVPDPYYVTNALEITPTTKILKFVNMPSQAIVRIYSVSGILVQVLTNNDLTGGGEMTWNLRNRNNQFVASGVYFYHVETPDGKSKVGRFTVVNFAQ